MSLDHLLVPTTVSWLAFLAASLLFIQVPGPSLLFTIGRALTVGRRDALLSVVGNGLGLLGQMLAVAFGLGALVAASATAYTVLRLAGAAYVVYLGVQAIRHRRGFNVSGRDPRSSPLALPTALRQGFVVGLTNPKAFMIFAAVLPQFVDRGEGHLTTQMLLLGVLAFFIGLVSDSVWAVTASQLRSWFNASPKRGEAMGLVGGLSMIGLGVGLAVTGRPE